MLNRILQASQVAIIIFILSGLGTGSCGKISDENKAPTIEVTTSRTDQTVTFSILVIPNGKMDPIKSGVVYVTTDSTEPNEESLPLTVDLTSQVVVGSSYEFSALESVTISSTEQVVLNFRAMFIMDHTEIKKSSTGQEESKQVELRVASPITTETYEVESTTNG